MLDRSVLGRGELLRRLVRLAPRYQAVIVDGAVGSSQLYVDLIAAGIIARRRRMPWVVISEATWKLGPSRLDRLACRAGARLLDTQKSMYCVLSSEELDQFPLVWGVQAERVVFTPFYYTLSEEELAAPRSADGGVFAGGSSLRDYEPLLVASGRLGVRVTIATTIAPRSGVPASVTMGPVSHTDFVDLLRRSAAVVVPLKAGLRRSAGQQTYLNAMALGKCVIVTEAPGVRDYVQHGVTGLVVPPGDASALEDALTWVLDPANERDVEIMRQRAAETALARFGPDNYADALLSVVERVTGLDLRTPTREAGL
jgi:hypothetical protein